MWYNHKYSNHCMCLKNQHLQISCHRHILQDNCEVRHDNKHDSQSETNELSELPKIMNNLVIFLPQKL